MWDGVARRAVDDVTRLEWLLDEPLTRRVWRYENTVRVCEFHKHSRSGGTTEGRHVNDSNISKTSTKRPRAVPSRRRPSVRGGVVPGRGARGRSGGASRCPARTATSRGRARALLAQELRRGGRGTVRPLALAQATEEVSNERQQKRRRRSFVRSAIELEPGDGLPDPTPGPFSTFATTEEPATAARRRA